MAIEDSAAPAGCEVANLPAVPEPFPLLVLVIDEVQQYNPAGADANGDERIGQALAGMLNGLRSKTITQRSDYLCACGAALYQEFPDGDLERAEGVCEACDYRAPWGEAATRPRMLLQKPDPSAFPAGFAERWNSR